MLFWWEKYFDSILYRLFDFAIQNRDGVSGSYSSPDHEVIRTPVRIESYLAGKEGIVHGLRCKRSGNQPVFDTKPDPFGHRIHKLHSQPGSCFLVLAFRFPIPENLQTGPFLYKAHLRIHGK